LIRVRLLANRRTYFPTTRIFNLKAYYLEIRQPYNHHLTDLTLFTVKSQRWLLPTFPPFSMLHLKISRCSCPRALTSGPRTCKFTWNPTSGRLALTESMSSTLARPGTCNWRDLELLAQNRPQTDIVAAGRRSSSLPASSQLSTTQPTSVSSLRVPMVNALS